MSNCIWKERFALFAVALFCWPNQSQSDGRFVDTLFRDIDGSMFATRLPRLRRYAPQLRMGVLPLVHIQLNPGRRVVAGMGSVADPTIDAGLSQARRQFGVKQQMIDAQSRILLPMLTEIVPEGVDAFLWIASAHGIGPSLSKQALIALAAFGL